MRPVMVKFGIESGVRRLPLRKSAVRLVRHRSGAVFGFQRKALWLLDRPGVELLLLKMARAS